MRAARFFSDFCYAIKKYFVREVQECGTRELQSMTDNSNTDNLNFYVKFELLNAYRFLYVEVKLLSNSNFYG